MNFLNPLALIGLAAASIPIIIHLLNLRKLKIVEFSSLRFLKELEKTKIKRLKIKQLLLLILRTLLIIFAVIALSRPITEGSIPGAESYAKTSAAVLIDNSFSMDLSDENGNRFKQAKQTAASILDMLESGDEGVVLPLANDAEQKVSLTRDFSILKEDASKIQISYEKANVKKALRKIAALMEKANNINREIYIISDAQSNSFFRDLKDSLSLFQNPPIVYFAKIGISNQAVNNLSIDSLRVVNKIFQYGKLVEIEARIRNGSGKNVEGTVVNMFFNDRKVAQTNVDIPKGETKTISIAASPQTYGIVKGRVQIEKDALPTDNKRHFGFIIPDKPRVALIGSEENARFIQIALSEKTSGEKPAKLDRIGANEIKRVDLSDYKIVICAGGPYSKSDFQKIENYVENGGSCLLFADAEMEFNAFADGLKSLGFANLKEVEYGQEETGTIVSIDKIHPLFTGVFKGETDAEKIVESPDINKIYAVQSGQSIIKSTSGNFLSENLLGDGKIIYCSVAPNLDWSDFPLTGLFPALVYRSIPYLSSRNVVASSLTAGESLKIVLPKKISPEGAFKIIDPNGKEFFKEAAELPSGAILSFRELERLGAYSVIAQDDRNVAVIAVNHPKSESVLQYFDEDEIETNLQEIVGEKATISIIDKVKNIRKEIKETRAGSELWRLFVLLAILTAIAETLVARNTKSEVEQNSN